METGYRFGLACIIACGIKDYSAIGADMREEMEREGDIQLDPDAQELYEDLLYEDYSLIEDDDTCGY